MLNYGEALPNLSDDKIIRRLFDWNCEWLSRPNIAISEMASTLKENWSNIMAYRGTVFTEDFVDHLRRFVDPITDDLRRVGNKDKLDTDPPDAKDVLTVGPVLMMAIHVLEINYLMHNPDMFAEKTLRAATFKKFKADPTFKNLYEAAHRENSHKQLGFSCIFARR